MALILTYRLEPPDAVTQEVYRALKSQVGSVGLDLQVPLDDTPAPPMLKMTAQFISVGGEHVDTASAGTLPPMSQDEMKALVDARRVREAAVEARLNAADEAPS